VTAPKEQTRKKGGRLGDPYGQGANDPPKPEKKKEGDKAPLRTPNPSKKKKNTKKHGGAGSEP